ncbi:MAG TPA: YdeI/OmpD-associated family protein [Candidatus Saccharimonadales bacterium]|nr:YdeI/OmpD-associated family protein [Candidatus Saccharimonadales bacterium]
MSAIRFETTLFNIGSWVILRLPQSASEKLPSRGQAMVKGTINGVPFQIALEPDGKGSHWFKVDSDLQKSAKAGAGDAVVLAIEPTKDWPEPEVPKDLYATLQSHPRALDVWQDVTPMARWEWIRWIGSTAQVETRRRRIEVACSKLMAGTRRPCCFNRNMCCVPDVSKNGVLLEPPAATK